MTTEVAAVSVTQVLIDRLRHVDVLEWLWWLNSHHKVTYRNMNGDKDTYRLAFALANKLSEYQQVKVPARDALSVVKSSRGTSYVHQGMVQHTPDGRPAFMHRTGELHDVIQVLDSLLSCNIWLQLVVACSLFAVHDWLHAGPMLH